MSEHFDKDGHEIVKEQRVLVEGSLVGTVVELHDTDLDQYAQVVVLLDAADGFDACTERYSVRAQRPEDYRADELEILTEERLQARVRDYKLGNVTEFRVVGPEGAGRWCYTASMAFSRYGQLRTEREQLEQRAAAEIDAHIEATS